MHKRYVMFLLLFALTLSSTACSLVITPPPPAALNPNGAIFTAEQGEAALDVLGSNVEGVWEPTAEDVAKLEAALPAFLQTAENPWLKNDPPIWERIPDYMRQYLGIVEDGKQLIYANFFCTNYDSDWHEEFVFVMDGGDCFLQVKFDPATGTFTALSVNGEG